LLDVSGISYEIQAAKNVLTRLIPDESGEVELFIYHYLTIDKSKAMPVLIGFSEELEKDFFEKFITVSGVGPKAALKAFDKPIAAIASAIEQGDLNFLTSLVGIGKQRAKQIVAQLQGKVGRFALLKGDEPQRAPIKKEIIEQAKEILKRLQYSSRESADMVSKAFKVSSEIDTVEDLLNEIYRQRA
tara:strand:- start:792 stop:1352 length:561 start_codon:yes stop_codon:yes gene_type:complete